MFVLKNEIQFDTAHYLCAYPGKCANIHGHRYRLIVCCSCAELHTEGPLRGMVEDFHHIRNILKEVEDFFDHRLLVEYNADGKRVYETLNALPNHFALTYVPFRPTCEEMARYIFSMLKNKGLPVSAVELFETPTNSCIYQE